MYIYKMSYRAAAVDAGKRALENAAKSTKWSGGQKRERDRREEKEERETQHWRVSSVKNERFYCILAHCVCVCVLHATPVGSCLICWWISQSAAQTTRRSRGGKRRGGGGGYKAQGQKVLNGSVRLEAICCTSTFSCSCSSCNVFASLKAAASFLRTHSSKFWLMIEWSSSSRNSRSSHSSSSSATDEQQLLNDRSKSKGNNFKFFPILRCSFRFVFCFCFFFCLLYTLQNCFSILLNFHFPLETLTCNLPPTTVHAWCICSSIPILHFFSCLQAISA